MKILALFFLLVHFPLLARFELVTDGTFDINHYQKVIGSYHPQETIVECNLKQILQPKKTKGALSQKRFKFTPRIQLDPEIRKIVFMNIPRKGDDRKHLNSIPEDKLVLFMWEPPIRLRKMYAEKIQSCFGKIYTWNDDLVDNQKYFKFYYPCKRSMIKHVVPFEDKRFCTMIVGHTTDKSKHHPNELYSHRICAIEFFQEKQESGFEFYGKNWDSTQYPSYRGEITDKIGANRNYKFTICYENCRDVPGYITEKIFDCFAAGSIPIYWGAPNITKYIPDNCFIDRRRFSSLDDLYAFLKSMSKDEYEGYIRNIRNFLASEESELFSQKNYERIFAESVL